MTHPYPRERRLISRSMESLTKSARVSPVSSSGSMRAFVPMGTRVGNVSNSFFGLAMRFPRYLLLTGVAGCEIPLSTNAEASK